MKTSTLVDYIAPSWPASLVIEFSVRPEKTVPSKIKHYGPLRVQRPFYPEKDGCCHLYLLHPPGGVVGGDVLKIDVLGNKKSNSLVTTPGATKIYRSNSQSKIYQSIKLKNESVLEWMPQETIVFNEAQTKIETQVHITKDSQLFFWDILCLGLPVNNERFSVGDCQQSLKIFRDEIPILIENNVFEGGAELLSSFWGMQGFYVNAITVMTSDDLNIVEEIRSLVKSSEDCLFAVTRKQGLMICRYMGNSVDEAKRLFQKAWVVWRKNELGKNVVVPRIWGT